MSYTLISEKNYIARKPHACIWCGQRVVIGERYVREFSVFDGDTQKLKWHPECRQAALDGWRSGDDEEFSPGENERPPTAASIEFDSWDCSLLGQGRMALDGTEPSPGLLMSMAMRYDHGLGVPGYYDSIRREGDPTRAQRLESTLRIMRQLWEEAGGNGFYSADREAEYAALAATESPASRAP